VTKVVNGLERMAPERPRLEFWKSQPTAEEAHARLGTLPVEHTEKARGRETCLSSLA